MESDSPLPWAIAASWALFLLVSLGESSLASVKRDRVNWLVTQGARGSASLQNLFADGLRPADSLAVLKWLFVVSGMVSLGALVISRTGVHLGWLSFGAALAFLLLGATRAASAAIATVFGERIALGVSPLLSSLAKVVGPVHSMEAAVLLRLRRAAADQPESHDDEASPEISIPFDSNGEPLDEHEVRMIRGVVRLDKTPAREIMVPRVDMVAVELGASLEEVARLMVESGHSRIPVYQDHPDRIQGIVYARDVIGHLSEKDVLTESLIRPALFVPESKTLEELLSELRQKRVHIAIVVDEYGGVAGLVTIEDLLEEIVGEIQDEFDVGEPEVQPVNEREFLLDARVSIEEMNQLFKVVVEADGFDTVGGFVYQRLGKIPSSGDIVEYDGLKIEVVSTVGRRLKKLRVVMAAPEDVG